MPELMQIQPHAAPPSWVRAATALPDPARSSVVVQPRFGHRLGTLQGGRARGAAPEARGLGASPVLPRPPVVQRAVGYEVEVGGIQVYADPDSKTPPDIRKGLVLWQGAGWEVTVDELPAESKSARTGPTFDIELRTSDPIDDLASNGRAAAQSRLQALAQEWGRLEAKEEARPASFYSGSAPANIMIDSRGRREHEGQLQATAGLSLDALTSVRSGAALRKLSNRRHANIGFVGDGGTASPNINRAVAARLEALRASLGLGRRENLSHMATIIGMIVEIPASSWTTPGLYAKSFAGGLLARTDFATLLRQLPPSQVRAIATHPDAWRGELMEITRHLITTGRRGADPVADDAPVFRPGSAPGVDALAPHLHMRDWFQGLAAGSDRLTKADYARRHPGQPEAEELESLGAYGARMDLGRPGLRLAQTLEVVAGAALMVAGLAARFIPIEGAEGLGTAAIATGAVATAHGASGIQAPRVGDRPIFEFRRLGSTYQPILVDAGLAVWDYVAEVHGVGPTSSRVGRALRGWNWGR